MNQSSRIWRREAMMNVPIWVWVLVAIVLILVIARMV